MQSFDELRENIKGVVVVMTTPFKDNYEVDEEGVRKLTRFLIDSGIKRGTGVLVPTGSTGECPMLSDEERARIFKIVKEEAGDAVPVLGGCNHTDTRTVIKLVKYAEEAGLDGVMISPPYYWKPNEEIILTHYKAIARESKMGIMVYNNWFASQWDIPVETLAKLVDEVPNIVALKENTPYIEKFWKVVNAIGDKISVINGSGEPHEPYTALMGARGFVTGEACIIPQTCVAIYQAETQKDYEKAKDILLKAKPLLDFFFAGEHGASYLIRIKAAMNLVGLPGGIPRLPLLPASEEIKQQAKKLLDEYPLPEPWNKK
ncbi:dihydrodipicolinate synthase family protein [Atrimonas thermophila]|jgi:4-hydroxy-tetrahydrodipicolinate synthase|uniref:dihydrodipicolinate synthase family protein n=1 Tax=Atrimonas thermophila TaxID=3064161 RepID=UPI00399C995B